MNASFIAVPPGKLASIVTHLEMRRRQAANSPGRGDLLLEHVQKPGLDWYRALFRSVGEDWLWFMRLSLADAALAAIIHDHRVEVHVLKDRQGEIGLLELEFEHEKKGHCQLSYFGLVPRAIGSGAGRWLMDRAIERVWDGQREISCFSVHTCTLDHPSALSFYQQSGFAAVRREIEIADDPRLDGRLPRGAAKRIPVIR